MRLRHCLAYSALSMLARRARGRRASPTRRSRSARRAAAEASGARAASRAGITRDGRVRARARRRRALLRRRAAASVTRLPIFLIFACELLELGRGMARLERIVSLIVVSHAPSISAMPRGAPTSTAPPHQDRRRASKLLSRIREVADRNRRYVSHSKANEGICELAPRVFPGQKFQHKVFRMQLLTYRRFLSATSRFRDKSGTGPRRFPGNRCHAAVFAAAAKTRLPHPNAPAPPRRTRRAFTGRSAARGSAACFRAPLNWDCRKGRANARRP